MTDILYDLLLLDGNNITRLDKTTQDNFRALIVEVAKAEKNVRFCSTKGCICHPETKIKILLEGNNELVKFLNEYHQNLVEDLLRHCDDYEAISVYDNLKLN